jgi:hypothetical protein
MHKGRSSDDDDLLFNVSTAATSNQRSIVLLEGQKAEQIQNSL